MYRVMDRRLFGEMVLLSRGKRLGSLRGRRKTMSGGGDEGNFGGVLLRFCF